MNTLSPNFPPEGSASWLRRERHRCGFHQHQLAAKLDLNQGRISEWENEVKPIPAERVRQLRSIFEQTFN